MTLEIESASPRADAEANVGEDALAAGCSAAVVAVTAPGMATDVDMTSMTGAVIVVRFPFQWAAASLLFAVWEQKQEQEREGERDGQNPMSGACQRNQAVT